ncbi:MAG TPA: hypothetical protein DCE41_13250 [Cytophagales bacterium]|nr:hypothetical protein [Cytophagales bacterium]HAA20415.1 hypothetical protein [Cytophagales bacterium]HAP58557.1 hypothetical protein [Cytophagales bacterium]
METPSQCLNCGADLHGPYCHVCGQAASVGKVTFRETFEQFLSSAFSLQGPLRRTFRGLLMHPERVYREFIAGKRKTYYQPISWFILLTAIYLIIRTLLAFDPLAGQDFSPSGQPSEMGKHIREAAYYMLRNINNIMFFLVLSTALWLKVFFWRAYSLAEYAVIGLYVGGMYIILAIIIMLISHLFHLPHGVIQLPLLGILILFHTISLFLQRRLGTYIKAIFVAVFSVLFYILFSFGFSLLVISF